MNKPQLTAEHELARRSRRGFLILGGGLLTGVAAWTYLRSRPLDGGIPGPFRRILEWNEKITSSALFSGSHFAPEFPRSREEDIRANGDLGLDDDIEDDDWKLRLTPRGSEAAIELLLSDVRVLPKTDLIAEFKCIEGWSSIVQWRGVRFRDFLQQHAPLSEKAAYVAMATPDGEYYVGIDMASAIHPQTLLAYEMNGKPLRDEHGAPLRLVTPVKYGIKNIKRIGTISFSDKRPPDYWAERGYDYYSGL